MEWHQKHISKRIEEIYAKWTTQDFWKWWSSGQPKVMEVRITDYALIQEVALKLNIPYSISGVYVHDYIQLRQVIREVRDRATMWMGVNPRKKAFNKFGKKVFGGTDYNIDSVDFIFVDIDRIVKHGEATNDELGKCEGLCFRLLKKLQDEGWANSYAKICTGNGVQLLIKLDHPIRLPEVQYQRVQGGFTLPIASEEFEQAKKIIRNGIGQQIIKASNMFKDELGVEVDKSCFNIGRVGALPFTKNFKYNGFTWRGIVELKDGENVGLTDYVMSKIENEKEYNKHQIYGRAKREHRLLKPGKLKENELVQFMFTQDFPSGGINNTLWMQLKCLLRDSKIDLTSLEFMQLHMELRTKHKRTFTLNMPEQKYEFNEDVVNHYCIDNMIPPLYPLWRSSRPLTVNMCLDNLCVEHLIRVRKGVKKLPDNTTFWEDMESCKQELIIGDYNNIDRVIFFVRGLIEKFGITRATYLLIHVLKDYFQRNSK